MIIIPYHIPGNTRGDRPSHEQALVYTPARRGDSRIAPTILNPAGVGDFPM
ncbi:MAG: hypothetical protein ACRC8Y_26650 [Chroococcales cyanobacterium]